MKPYHIPAWEEAMLREVVVSRYPAAREEALRAYIEERERRRRHAATRDKRDAQRRTLVGAHVSRELANQVAAAAADRGISVTALVKRAVLREVGA